MPATVKVKICEARNLPIMDRGGETTDAFVEVRLANNVFKTEVCRRTLDPKWDSDWFKFDVKDIELQEDPLQIRIMDYDTYSSHDAIGKVYVDLTNMLVSENRSSHAGWLPIYDTLLGIRGQLRIEIRLITFCVDMKSSWHPSQNVLFFASSLFPSGFHVKRIVGLVDHLIVADDPEHQWLIDKLRTPRSTNEARQLLFMKMSGELRRKVGGKVVEMGGNAVIALQQRIDLANVGIILRAIGTAVVVEKAGSELASGETTLDLASKNHLPAVSPVDRRRSAKVDKVPFSGVEDMATSLKTGIDRGNANGTKSQRIDVMVENEQADLMKLYLGSSQDGDPQEGRSTSNVEFPFLTIKHFPAGLIKSLGGNVSCKLIKTLERVEQDDINQAPYALWWKELRSEVYRLMKSIGCNAVIGYSEDLTLTDMGNIQLLCASGTAAVLDINLAVNESSAEAAWNSMTPGENIPKEQSTLQHPEMVGMPVNCYTFHFPSGIYSEHAAPTSALCSVCQTGFVPDMLLLTIEPFAGMPIKGTGTLIQARVAVRRNKTFKGENGARELSEALPFVEFELHSQISTKLRLLGLNVVFGLKVDINCGSEVIVALATGTGLYITALPKPARLTVLSEKQNTTETVDLQTRLDGLIEQQMRQLGLADEKEDVKTSRPSKVLKPNLGHGKRKKTGGSRQYSKAGFIIDLEDETAESKDLLSLIDYLPPKETLLFGSEICPIQDRTRQQRYSEYMLAGRPKSPLELQNFCRVWRSNLLNEQDELVDILPVFKTLLRDIIFRARVYRPCRICGLEFRICVTSDEELLVLVMGSILPEPVPLYGLAAHKVLAELRRPQRQNAGRTGISGSDDNTDTAGPPRFHIEGSFNTTLLAENLYHDSLAPSSTPLSLSKPGTLAASRNRISPPRLPQLIVDSALLSETPTRHPSHVEISSLSFAHASIIKRYVGNLNLVVLRECQTLREVEGPSGFMQLALSDVYAMARAQTLASGGNMILSFRISQLQMADSYNQAQCIIYVSGDMVEAEDSVFSTESEA